MKDTIRLNGFGKPKMPKLHGHIKVTTSYAKSGNIAEVVECDNIVTNAIADIFANDYLNGINAGSMLPLWSKWFSGILMYGNAFALNANDEIDPDNYFPEADNVNKLYAHAGDTAPSDTADDTRRGSPNTIAQVVSDGSVKLAWEWGSLQGNTGENYIRSVALTHADTGNAGLGSASNAFAGFTPLASIGNLGAITSTKGANVQTLAMYDENHCLDFNIGEANQATSTSLFETAKVSVNIKRLALFKTGLVDTVSADTTMKRTFTVTTPITFYMQPSYWFDYEHKYLWLFTNITGQIGSGGYRAYSFSRTDVRYCVIDCENEELVNLGTSETPVYYKTVVSDASDLAPLSCNWGEYNDTGRPQYNQLVGDGTSFCFPMGDCSQQNWYNGAPQFKGVKKFNLSTGVQTAMPLASSVNFLRPAMYGGGLVVGDGFVGNGTASYPCTTIFSSSNQSSYAFQTVNRISTYAFPIASSQSNSRARYIFANKLVHTTMLNLPQAVQKTSAKNMNVEYTLTEVSGE